MKDIEITIRRLQSPSDIEAGKHYIHAFIEIDGMLSAVQTRSCDIGYIDQALAEVSAEINDCFAAFTSEQK